ncbi:hypothetical protein N658DRAFT_294955 [Parathielavia hyrcaniae]|uniref:Uncharacterized protein n=1 Tax=Parathielavia hyrcaniae TaxID=113614 RepID=A0AAN6SYA2_9PEZI|nr:hypothetical protein N658DRAFT_294955 [Parathielavia hyrcaniae]
MSQEEQFFLHKPESIRAGFIWLEFRKGGYQRMAKVTPEAMKDLANGRVKLPLETLAEVGYIAAIEEGSWSMTRIEPIWRQEDLLSGRAKDFVPERHDPKPAAQVIAPVAKPAVPQPVPASDGRGRSPSPRYGDLPSPAPRRRPSRPRLPSSAPCPLSPILPPASPTLEFPSYCLPDRTRRKPSLSTFVDHDLSPPGTARLISVPLDTSTKMTLPRWDPPTRPPRGILRLETSGPSLPGPKAPALQMPHSQRLLRPSPARLVPPHQLSLMLLVPLQCTTSRVLLPRLVSRWAKVVDS